jgi:hypothetical protein
MGYGRHQSNSPEVARIHYHVPPKYLKCINKWEEFDTPANHKESHEYASTNLPFPVIYIIFFTTKRTRLRVSTVSDANITVSWERVQS